MTKTASKKAKSPGAELPTRSPKELGVAIVVGASSGIGLALARRLATEDRYVVLVARRAEELALQVKLINEGLGEERAFFLVHDAAMLDEADALFGRIEKSLGEAAELHFVAGIMPEVELDEFNTKKDADMFQVNTLGSIAWTNAAASRFQSRGRGHILGVTSVAGDRGRIGRPGYCASKAGQDAHLEALRNRLWRHGVRVTTIRPGFVLTPMTEDLGLKGAITADKAAELILKARNKKKAVVYVPFKWKIIMGVVKTIPSFVFRKMSM